MEYEVFKNKMQEKLQERMGSKGEVKVIQLKENNGGLRDELEYVVNDNNLTPGLWLEEIYELYKEYSFARMLDEIDKIMIYPTYMEVYLNVQKVLGVHGLSEVCEEKADYEIFKIEYGNMFDYKKEKSQEREAIVELIRENPDMTVKMMAEKLGISVVAARYRVKVLKSENRIRFNGAGGRGHWEIL